MTGAAQATAKAPAQPIEIIVPFGPGGGADQLARMAAPRLQALLKTPVTVTNVPGATGATGIAQLLERPADGRTLAVLTADTFSLLALTPPPWRLEDIEPLAVMIRQPSGLFVAGNSPIKTWADFEKAAKADPYGLEVAITGPGSPDDITIAYFAAQGVRLFPVVFDYPANRYHAVVSGKVDALYEQAGDVKAYLDKGELRPILFFSAGTPPEFKDVPAAAERDYDITLQQFRAFVVKAGTDPQAVGRLAEAIGELTKTSEYQTYLQEQFALPDSHLPREKALAFLQNELEETKKMADSVAYMPVQFKNQAVAPEPCNWGATDPCLEIDMTEEGQ
ncbi:MAG: tripartite tricarboxylate transporter substrate binding protein [Pseudomonadota bacterium]|nr:tripartite tricarboxylate transporter substrate binding protein [Pseudomonadota bacterium]